MIRTLRLKLSNSLVVTVNEVTNVAEIEMKLQDMPALDAAIPVLNKALNQDGVDGNTKEAIMSNVYNVIDAELVARALRSHALT
jgi:hypothetical protein